MSKREGSDTGPEPKRARAEFEKQRRDYYTSWDLFPTGHLDRGWKHQPWRIEFKGGLQSIFVIDGIAGAIPGADLELIILNDGIFYFEGYPSNLTVDIQRARQIMSELPLVKLPDGSESGYLGGDIREEEEGGEVEILERIYIESSRGSLEVLIDHNRERWNVVQIGLSIDTKDILSTMWQYAKDDPEEVVNAAAYRRQDLLGM